MQNTALFYPFSSLALLVLACLNYCDHHVKVHGSLSYDNPSLLVNRFGMHLK
jgi:hypothetical protein